MALTRSASPRLSGKCALWLKQAKIAALLEATPQNITQHLKATCKQDLQVRQEGGRSVSRRTRLYNLKAILAVGFRLRSPRGESDAQHGRNDEKRGLAA